MKKKIATSSKGFKLQLNHEVIRALTSCELILVAAGACQMTSEKSKIPLVPGGSGPLTC